MKQADLDILLREGEGSMLEYKEALSASLARDFAAFANTAGGKILLGVRDDGTVVGVADSNALRARIQDIARNCDPPVEIRIEPVGKVIVAHIRESASKPVQCSDGFFWRQGSTTQKLRREEIRDFFRSEGQIRFDLSLCPRFRYPQDFDRQKYTAWLRLTGISGRPRTEDVLVNVEAAERSGGTLVFRNAGVLFFARNVRHFFNQAYITCLLAKGTDKVHILDRKDFDGGIVSDIEDAMRFIDRNTRTAYRIERLQRENIPEYPMGALREAITNAVMHRDWFIEGANVFVEIYTDRIEVISPGGLPRGMTLADLGRKSVRRNALIADLLHRIAFIEKAGTGIKRIRDEVREQGCPEPVFENNGFFTAIFQPNPEVRAMAATQSSTQLTDQVAPQVPRKYPTSTPQVTGQVTRHVTGEVAGEVTPQVPGKSRGSTGEVAPQVHPKFTPSRTPSSPHFTGEVTAQVPRKYRASTAQVTAQVRAVLQAAAQAVKSREELQAAAGIKHREHFRKAYLEPLLNSGWIEMTIPDKPRSSKQRYRISPLGVEALKRQDAGESKDK